MFQSLMFWMLRATSSCVLEQQFSMHEKTEVKM
jgi:hypothetical protein